MADKSRQRRRRGAKKSRDQRQTTQAGELRFGPELPPDDPEGGTGVREPRRPRPQLPAGAEAVEPQPSQELDITGVPD